MHLALRIRFRVQERWPSSAPLLNARTPAYRNTRLPPNGCTQQYILPPHRPHFPTARCRLPNSYTSIIKLLALVVCLDGWAVKVPPNGGQSSASPPGVTNSCAPPS